VSEVIEDTRVGLIGKTIGRYRVTAELGRGGMATVYRAHDPQLGRDVAIKIMHGAFAGRAELEARFRREARAVAGIKHDGIVNVFDFAPATAGEPGYIVTELVEGPTLRTVMDRQGGRLLPEVAALVAVRLAGALGAAHARGIVHRDVKPDNVMFDLALPSTARVLLTDFGIAHMTEADTMTATGAIVGSPIYMSPEQARGQDIGPASDVFSLGVLLYHVTTGRPPFAGRDPLTAIAAILRGEFLRPSQVDAHVGPALEAVILRCMRTAPGERFPDGNALAAALGAIAGEVEKLLGVADGDAGAALRKFFDQASSGGAPLAATLGPRVAEQAFEQARLHLRRRELARALAETNRVFAYAPGHGGAQALLAGIARRRRAGKVVAAGAVALLVAGVGAMSARHWRVAHGEVVGREPASAALAAAGAGAGAAAPGAPKPPQPEPKVDDQSEPRAESATVAVLAAESPHPSASPATGPAGAAAAGHPRGAASRGHAGGVKLAGGPGAGASHPAPALLAGNGAAVAGETTAGVKAPAAAGGGPGPTAAVAAPPFAAPAPPTLAPAVAPVAVPVPAPAPAPAAPSASLVLRASQGFCSPSLDEQPPSIHPSYEHVTSGLHRIFCTLPGHPKAFVADYDLRAGSRTNLVIVPGADGRPTLSRPD
jgi:serine/threonine-protein kinase